MKVRQISKQEIELKAETKGDSNNLMEFFKAVVEENRKRSKLEESKGS